MNRIAFLNQTERWLPPDVERFSAILDNLSMHRATDVLLFSLAHPGFELVFQPTSAAVSIQVREVLWRATRFFFCANDRISRGQQETNEDGSSRLPIGGREISSMCLENLLGNSEPDASSTCLSIARGPRVAQ